MRRQKRYVAIKRWGNHRAFIVLNGTQIIVNSSFYTSDNKFCHGPSVEIGELTDQKIFDEIHQRECMGDKTSSELDAYIKSVWEKAKELNSWFNYTE